VKVDLQVAGLGLVSPSALTPEEHVFLLRAESTMGVPRAFVDAQGELVSAIHCPWLSPKIPTPRRVGELATAAALHAMRHAMVHQALLGRRLPMVLVTAAPWAAFGEAAPSLVERALVAALPVDPEARLTGEAGAFAGLQLAAERLSDPSVPAVLVVAADSSIGVVALTERARAARRWERVPAYVSEGAAALLLTRGSGSRAAGWPDMGRISFSATAAGQGSDEDDDPVDGRAMTALFRAASSSAAGKLTQSFGQHNVDELRQRTITFATARNKEAFDPICRLVDVEDAVGRVGAAAGAMQLAYALATERHGMAQPATGEWGGGGPFAAWAVSRDGTRGLAIAQGPRDGRKDATNGSQVPIGAVR
jgi:hypothetical protein